MTARYSTELSILRRYMPANYWKSRECAGYFSIYLLARLGHDDLHACRDRPG